MLNLVKNLVGFLAKYAVDANLFELGFTDPPKNTQPIVFFWGFCTGGLLSEGFCPGAFVWKYIYSSFTFQNKYFIENTVAVPVIESDMQTPHPFSAEVAKLFILY